MALLDRIRKAVRITATMIPDSEGREPDADEYVPTYSSPFDEELEMLIGAAQRDLLRVGIRKELVLPEEEADLGADVEQCITLYVKCHFGYDNAEAPRFGESYRMAVCDLMNSRANIAAHRKKHHHKRPHKPDMPTDPDDTEEPVEPPTEEDENDDEME